MLAVPAVASEIDTSPPWQNWSTLQLKVKSVPFMRGQVELRVRDTAAGRRLETSSQARFFGATIARSTSVSMLDPENGQARSYRTESKKKARRYTFEETAYSVEKLKRTKQNRPWESRSTRQYAYPRAGDPLQPLPVYDYFGMILRLRDEALKKVGDASTLHVATSSGPEAFVITVAEIRDGSRRIRRPDERERTPHATREMRLSVSPASEDSEAGFLDMKGEVEIWVEAESKTLLEIVGDVPGVPGKVHLVLNELG